MKRFCFSAGLVFLAQLFIFSPLAGQCPSSILYKTTGPCGWNWSGFYLTFPSSTGGPNSGSFYYPSNGNPDCYFINNNLVNYQKSNTCGSNWWYANSSGCTQNPTGWTTFGSKQCYYNNGYLETCNDFLVPCTDELLNFAKDFVATPGADCKQWEGPCATGNEIHRSGTVVIGADTRSAGLAGYKLVVKGGIASEMLQICKPGWCDYVFSDSFRLMPLPEVRQYIRANGHLPGCTPGAVIERAGGFSLGDAAVQQQEKIEETFLHLIALRKRLDALSARTARLGLPAWSAATPDVPLPPPNEEGGQLVNPNTAAPPALSLQCYQIVPATGNTTSDGQAGILISGQPVAPLTVQWAGPVNGSLNNQTCTAGLIKLTGLKMGSYTVRVIEPNGTFAICTLTIATGTPVSCAKLAEEPCKTEIFNTIKAAFAATPPTCVQWSGDPCSTSGHIHRPGNVGIGTSNVRTGYSLAVQGGILTDRFYIELCEKHGWCDYVFDPGYALPDLYTVEQHINAYQRLPGTVSQAEVTTAGGIELRSVKLDQQKKIEESYLYLIGMNKKMVALQNQINSFE